MIAKSYRRYKKMKENSLVRLHQKKTYLMEWFAVLKKRNLYKNIKWTKDEKKAFNDYWVSAYGRRISPRWHKLYQSINGVFNIEYFPDILFSTNLELKLNPFLLCEQLQVKAFPELLFGNTYRDNQFVVRTPTTYALGYGDCVYDSNRRVTNLVELASTLKDLGPCIIKPVKDSSSGRGFKNLNFVSGIDINTGKTIKAIFEDYSGNFILQEKLHNCEAVKLLYSNALNTIRIITYICDGRVYHCPLSMRIGSGGGEVDNIHAGGIVIGLSDEGVLKERAFKLGYCNSNVTYAAHPDSGIAFKGYQIPNINRVITAAHQMHGRLPGVGIISWDFILDENEYPVIIETNLLGQSVWFTQVVNGCSMFGINTGKMIEYCSKMGNNKRFL